MRKPRSPSASLEREVIVSVVVLYVFICAAMLTIHYSFAGQETRTSSTSPSHEALSTTGPAAAGEVRP